MVRAVWSWNPTTLEGAGLSLIGGFWTVCITHLSGMHYFRFPAVAKGWITRLFGSLSALQFCDYNAIITDIRPILPLQGHEWYQKLWVCEVLQAGFSSKTACRWSRAWHFPLLFILMEVVWKALHMHCQNEGRVLAGSFNYLVSCQYM